VRGDRHTLVPLPQEYLKKPFDDLDREFVVILLASFILHLSMVGYFLLYPPSTAVSESMIAQIQKHYANMVLDREEQAVRVANQLIDQMPGAKKSDRLAKPARRMPGAGQMRSGQAAGRSAPAERDRGAGLDRASEQAPPSSRADAMQQAEAQAGGQGLLAILTSGRGASQDQTVRDVLAQGGKATQNFDQVFQNVDQLAASGRPGPVKAGALPADPSSRGGRTTSSGVKSKDIISDLHRDASGPLGSAKTAVNRNEKIEMADLADLTEEESPGQGGSAAGARDISQVSAIVYGHSQAIQYCYERELKRNPELKGKVVVRFAILANGATSQVTIVSSSLQNENVERCILSRISRWDDFGAIDERLGSAVFRQVYTFGF
jgi:hypothetical protein